MDSSILTLVFELAHYPNIYQATQYKTMNMENTYRVVRLLRNRLYPTYQFYAQMANRKTEPRDGLRLAALITMRWLQRRLGEPLPDEWPVLPEIANYREAADAAFPSLHINQGFVVDIVSLPEQGMWTLQITEPDLGSDPGNPEQKRAPVPGRIIETNIAFCVVNNALECGFQTVISDPEGTEQRAEVYRLAVIRQLSEHPDFGLRQLTTLTPKPEHISTAEQVKNLVSVWHDAENQMPCVIFTKPVETNPPKPLDASSAFGFRAGSALTDMRNIGAGSSFRAELGMKSSLPIVEAKPEKKKSPSPLPAPKLSATVKTVVEPPYDVAHFAKYGISFCRTYVLEEALFDRFCQLSGTDGSPGDIFVLEPDSFGGAVGVLPLKPSQARRGETMERLKERMYAYPLEKTWSFGHIQFLSAARENLMRHTDDAMRRAEELGGEWEQRLQMLQAGWKAALAEKDAAYAALAEQLDRQKEYHARLEREKDELREKHAAEADKLKAAIVEEQEDNAFLRRKLRQPCRHEEIAAWAEEYFGERLILHPKAVSMLSDKSARTVDIGLICDALDFLATDYWECRYQIISEDEMLLNCSRKYGRPFEIAPVGERTIQFAREEYTIPYYRDAQGKLRDSVLDCHLKVGNDAENLLRIYFLHDDEKRTIVVGSLPRHLTTATIQ